jgi:hypothetical protein
MSKPLAYREATKTSRIMYKAEGGGIQNDTLCQDGSTYQFYFRNKPAPADWRKKGLSPLHSRVSMALFDNPKDKYHHCGCMICIIV